MNDRLALIAACVADPSDDTRHLALADWLDEFGTSDADRARSEWIRLSCSKRRLNPQYRVRGENGWIYKNGPRLWPALFQKCICPPNFVSAGKSGKVSIEVHLSVSAQHAEAVTVQIYTRKGVTSKVALRFRDAARIAHVLASDEPFAPMSFSWVPPAAMDHYQREVVVFKWGGFKRYGLEGVWEEIERTLSPSLSVSKVYSQKFFGNGYYMAARTALHSALTRWARKKAGVPHVLLPAVLPEEPEPPSAGNPRRAEEGLIFL